MSLSNMSKEPWPLTHPIILRPKVIVREAPSPTSPTKTQNTKEKAIFPIRRRDPTKRQSSHNTKRLTSRENQEILHKKEVQTGNSTREESTEFQRPDKSIFPTKDDDPKTQKSSYEVDNKSPDPLTNQLPDEICTDSELSSLVNDIEIELTKHFHQLGNPLNLQEKFKLENTRFKLPLDERVKRYVRALDGESPDLLTEPLSNEGFKGFVLSDLVKVNNDTDITKSYTYIDKHPKVCKYFKDKSILNQIPDLSPVKCIYDKDKLILDQISDLSPVKCIYDKDKSKTEQKPVLSPVKCIYAKDKSKLEQIPGLSPVKCLFAEDKLKPEEIPGFATVKCINVKDKSKLEQIPGLPPVKQKRFWTRTADGSPEKQTGTTTSQKKSDCREPAFSNRPPAPIRLFSEYTPWRKCYSAPKSDMVDSCKRLPIYPECVDPPPTEPTQNHLIKEKQNKVKPSLEISKQAESSKEKHNRWHNPNRYTDTALNEPLKPHRTTDASPTKQNRPKQWTSDDSSAQRRGHKSWNSRGRTNLSPGGNPCPLPVLPILPPSPIRRAPPYKPVPLREWKSKSAPKINSTQGNSSTTENYTEGDPPRPPPPVAVQASEHQQQRTKTLIQESNGDDTQESQEHQENGNRSSLAEQFVEMMGTCWCNTIINRLSTPSQSKVQQSPSNSV